MTSLFSVPNIDDRLHSIPEGTGPPASIPPHSRVSSKAKETAHTNTEIHLDFQATPQLGHLNQTGNVTGLGIKNR